MHDKFSKKNQPDKKARLVKSKIQSWAK